MQNPIKAVAGWVVDAIVDKISEPFNAINKRLNRLEKLHEQDAAALECDLSMMDDRICYMIGVCRRRGYTTEDERRRVGRMHRAYHARGGNDGETEEYAIFCKLPTKEEFEHAKGA